MPNLSQLKTELSSHNDSIDNRLILKLDGDFKVVPFNSQNDISNFETMDYITRWETLDAGNDYVGPTAAQDTNFTAGIMEWATEAWKIHQKDNRVKILNPNS